MNYAIEIVPFGEMGDSAILNMQPLGLPGGWKACSGCAAPSTLCSSGCRLDRPANDTADLI